MAGVYDGLWLTNKPSRRPVIGPRPRKPVGAENVVTSRDLHVFVYQAAGPVLS